MTPPSLVSVGDVSFGDHYACASIGVNAMLRRHPDIDLFSDVRGFISSADLAFVNLETVLSDRGLDRRRLPSMHMRGRPQDVHRLVDAGFDIVNVANNHMLQHGADAFLETVDILKNNGLGVVGLAKPNGLNCIPYRTKLGNKELIFLGYGFEKDLYFEGTTLYAQGVAENILDDVQTHKTKDNIVICSFHWGREFISYPNMSQIEIGRKVIDQGCDLILGHHPHVLNGFETWKDKLIFYSLGNFVFDQTWNPSCTEGCMIKLSFQHDRFAVDDLQITEIGPDYTPTMKCPSVARQRFDELADTLEKSANNNGANYLADWTELNKKNRHASWRHMLRNFFRYDRHILRQIIADTLSKKIGLR